MVLLGLIVGFVDLVGYESVKECLQSLYANVKQILVIFSTALTRVLE